MTKCRQLGRRIGLPDIGINLTFNPEWVDVSCQIPPNSQWQQHPAIGAARDDMYL